MRNSTFFFGLLLCASVQAAFAQSAPSNVVLANTTSTAPRVPEYLVYRHFLGWVSTLDKQSIAANETDPYKFAEPFATHAGLANGDLDSIRKEAREMASDLANWDAQASGVIAAFRAKAKQAAAAGHPLPPAPVEIHGLQQGRTAILIQHLINLQSSLTPIGRSRLDQYLGREFTPHLQADRIAIPAESPSTAQSQAFAVAIP